MGKYWELNNKVRYFTQEIADDLHSVRFSLLTPAATFRSVTYRYCQKHWSLSLHDLRSTGRHLLGLAFIASLSSNLRTALTTQNKTKK